MSNDQNIHIGVETRFIDEQSDPTIDRYVFAYTVTIENRGSAPAQLLNRHWVITDAAGKVQEVRGEGVVGEQPHLKPGEAFRYTSGTVLPTPTGRMHGEYEMITPRGDRFFAVIPAFELDMPRVLH